MRRLSQAEWIRRANLKHNNKYDYSEVNYLKGKSKVKILCPEHGIFEQCAANHLEGKGCSKCSTGVLLSVQQWITKVRKKHGYFYDYSKVEFKGVKKQVTIICPVHGSFQRIAEKHFICGCRVCAQNNPITASEFVRRANIIHKNKYDYSLIKEIKGIKNKVVIICPKHGLFKQIVANHIKGKGRGCKYCSVGNSSRKEQDWLNSLGIPNDDKHRNVFIFINNQRFCVDGIYPEAKMLFEFLGDFWHGHPKTFDPNKKNAL